MAYVYHYYAMAQIKEGIAHLDGILTCVGRIDDMKRYGEIKHAIANANGEELDVGKLTVCSLEFLHESSDEVQP